MVSRHIPRSTNLEAMAAMLESAVAQELEDGWSGERPCRRSTPRLLAPSLGVERRLVVRLHRPGTRQCSLDTMTAIVKVIGCFCCCYLQGSSAKLASAVGVLGVSSLQCEVSQKTSCLVAITASMVDELIIITIVLGSQTTRSHIYTVSCLRWIPSETAGESGPVSKSQFDGQTARTRERALSPGHIIIIALCRASHKGINGRSVSKMALHQQVKTSTWSLSSVAAKPLEATQDPCLRSPNPLCA